MKLNLKPGDKVAVKGYPHTYILVEECGNCWWVKCGAATTAVRIYTSDIFRVVASALNIKKKKNKLFIS